jgi:hypothetical protein
MHRIGLKLRPWWPAFLCVFLALLLLARHAGWSPITLFRGNLMLPVSPESAFGDEFRLINRISAENIAADERQRLIAELDALPVRIYPFHSRWLLINNVYPAEAWDDDGFHPERCRWSRDVQLLWATSYGKADIDNGGFHQFSWNHTGAFAPEMHECLEKMGFNDAASAVKKAMLVFGRTYPRSQAARQRFLQAIPGAQSEEGNPFRSLDEEFYAGFDRSVNSFNERADRWLRERCGITHLSD